MFSAMDPHGDILGFLDLGCYHAMDYFFRLSGVMSQYVDNSCFSTFLATVTSPTHIKWFPNRLQ
jgi:hypothetical protein